MAAWSCGVANVLDCSVLANLKVDQIMAVTIMRPDPSGGTARPTRKVTLGELSANPR